MKLNVATFVLLLAIAAIFGWTAAHLQWTPERVIGMAMAIPSLLLLCLARIQLGRAFSLEAKASTLVTTGLYARIRNPIYVFGWLTFAGVIIWSGRFWLLTLLVAMIPLQIKRARKESSVLEEKFGPAYLQYKQRTWF